MLIHNIKVKGLLSFGPQGIDLPLEPLNVFVGPNSAGKSNLTEILALLKNASSDFFKPTRGTGGTQGWLWEGAASARKASIEVIVEYPKGVANLRHEFEITESQSQFILTKEWIGYDLSKSNRNELEFIYRMSANQALFKQGGTNFRRIPIDRMRPERSILSQVRDPITYRELNVLSEQYDRIEMYRNWTIGPTAPMRLPGDVHSAPLTFLENGENAALVYANFPRSTKNAIVDALREIYDNIVNIETPSIGGRQTLLVNEEDGRSVAAVRLSDGTLRYLSLLMILLHPKPPGLIVIEEPELGLHPDVISKVGDLLVDASQRTQLLVTTHSPILLDALSPFPTSVVVCTREREGSNMERLETEKVSPLLENSDLGDLWMTGAIGGTRW